MSALPVSTAFASSVSRRAGKGAMFTLAGSITQNAIRIGSSAVLARILGPEAFGLFGMAYLTYDLITRFGLMGMAGGVVAKSSLDEHDLSTCFWGMCFFGFLVSGAAFALAPLISFGVRDGRIVSVLKLIVWLLAITCLTSVSRAILRKTLRFKALAAARTLAVAAESATAISLALNGAGYWALVYGMAAGAFVEGLCVVVLARWIPNLHFRKDRFPYFLRFGVNGVGSSLLAYLSSNVDYWFAVKLLGLKALGYYEFAYRLPHMIIERFAGPAGSVMFPAMAAIREDKLRVLDWYMRFTKNMALCIFPCFAGLFIVAHPLVTVLWGSKWLPVVPLLKILCVGAALNSFWFLHRAVYLSQDRPDLPVKIGGISLMATGIAVGLGGWQFGLKGIALGMTVARAVELIWVWRAVKLLGGKMREWFAALFAPVSATLMMTITLLIIQRVTAQSISNPAAQLTLLIPLGICIYLGIIRMLFSRDYSDFMNIVRLVLKRE